MTVEASPLDHLWNVFTLFHKDVTRCIGALKDPALTDEDEKLFWGRMLARSVFALIEGVTYNMAGAAFLFRNVSQGLSSEEIEELENAYDFYEFQEPPIELKKAQTLNRIQRAFTLFAHVFHADDFLLTDKPEWELMDDLYDWKRIWTHPRGEGSLRVDAENRAALIAVAFWFMQCVLELLDVCQASGAKLLDQETGPIM